MAGIPVIRQSAGCGGARGIAQLVVACTAFAVCPVAHGQGRGPSVGELKREGKIDPPPSREQKLTGLDAWLRRMPGRYRVVDIGNIAVSDGGVMDCIAIGEGTGVNCMSGAGLFDRRHSAPPTMSLYGIDPDSPGIRYLKVDEVSMAESNLGVLSDDALRFFGTCPTPPAQPAMGPGPAPSPIRCALELRIELPSGGQDLVTEERRTVTSVIRVNGRTRIVSSILTRRKHLQRVPD